MTRHLTVIDASFTLSAILPGEDADVEEAFHQAVAEGAAAPSIWIYECANALLVAERRGRLTADQRAGYVEDIFALPIRIEDAQRSRAAGEVQHLAVAHGLTLYDAAYLEFAARSKARLATRDRRLTAAAQAMKIGLV